MISKIWFLQFIHRESKLLFQIIRYARACSTYDQFLARGSLLTNKLMSQGFQLSRLQAAFRKFYGRYNDLISHTTFLWATCCLICFIPSVKSFLTNGSWLRFVCLFWVARAIFQLSGECKHITGDRVANLDLCLALTAFSSEGSCTCHTYCDTGPPFLRPYPKDPVILTSERTVLLAKQQPLRILNALGLTQLVRAGLELTTSRLLSESSITRLRQQMTTVRTVYLIWK
jgi:hypothetical protein